VNGLPLRAGLRLVWLAIESRSGEMSHKLNSARESEFREHRGELIGYSSRRDRAMGCDFTGSEAVDEQLGHVTLRARQVAEQRVLGPFYTDESLSGASVRTASASDVAGTAT
jgi:hypothetical protein